MESMFDSSIVNSFDTPFLLASEEMNSLRLSKERMQNEELEKALIKLFNMGHRVGELIYQDWKLRISVDDNLLSFEDVFDLAEGNTSFTEIQNKKVK
jgi:hypothetical protein